MAEKNVRTGTALFSVLIAACVSFGGICCVTTAFKLSADLSLILLFCIGFAVFCKADELNKSRTKA